MPRRRAFRPAAVRLAPFACALPLAATAQTFDGTMSGHWWNPARAGEGQFITFESAGSRRVTYLAYFTYGPDGAAIWYVGNADYPAGASSVTVPLVTGRGGRFGADFRPSDVTILPQGTATLTFVSCSAMRLAFAGTSSFTVELSRAVGPLTGAPCGAEAFLVSGTSPFPAGCGESFGTSYVNAEVEPHLAVNPANPDHLVASWQQDRFSNGSARGVVTATSFDGGRTWTPRAMPFSQCGGGTYERATDPWVAFGPTGVAYSMALGTIGGSFTAGSSNAMLVARSTDGGRTWAQPVPLVVDTTPFFNDKNAITADPSDGRFAYAIWDRLQQGGRGPTIFTRTTDAGLTWEPARAVFDPGAQAQTIGNLVLAPPGGPLVALFAHLEPGPGNSTTRTIKAMRSTDRGASWGVATRVADLLSVGARDPRNAAPIRDGAILPQAAAGPDGSLHVVWQDARFSGGARDEIAYARSTDGGLTWSAPVRVNPALGTQAFIPSVAVAADGTVGVAYYDLRDDTADGVPLAAGYFLARSRDGVTWTETRLDGPFDYSLAPVAGGLFLGDYMGLVAAGGRFLALYARTTGDLDNRSDLYLARSGAGALSAKAEDGAWRAQNAGAFIVDAAWQARMDEATRAALARRGRPAVP